MSKKSSKESGGFSVSNSGSMGGGMNVSQGNKNKQDQTVVNSAKSTEEQQLSQADAITQIVKIEEIIDTSALPEESKKKLTSYLSAAKVAIDQDEPAKDIALPSLKGVSNILETLNGTLDSGKNIWEKVKPILVPVFSWLGGSLL